MDWLLAFLVMILVLWVSRRVLMVFMVLCIVMGLMPLVYFSPKWFLAENVGGLRNSNEGTAFFL